MADFLDGVFGKTLAVYDEEPSTDVSIADAVDPDDVSRGEVQDEASRGIVEEDDDSDRWWRSGGAPPAAENESGTVDAEDVERQGLEGETDARGEAGAAGPDGTAWLADLQMRLEEKLTPAVSHKKRRSLLSMKSVKPSVAVKLVARRASAVKASVARRASSVKALAKRDDPLRDQVQALAPLIGRCVDARLAQLKAHALACDARDAHGAARRVRAIRAKLKLTWGGAPGGDAAARRGAVAARVRAALKSARAAHEELEAAASAREKEAILVECLRREQTDSASRRPRGPSDDLL